MLMNNRTKAILDIERIINELHPITPFGIKLKKELKNYSREEKQLLLEELDRIEKLKELIQSQKPIFIELKAIFKQIKDIRRSIERCKQGGVLSTVELFELKNLGYLVEVLVKNQNQLQWNIPLKYKINELAWLMKMLDPENSGLKTFYIYDSYSEDLTFIRRKKLDVERKIDILKKLEIKQLEEELSISIKMNGEIAANKSNTELISRLKAHSRLQNTGETYINASFKIRFSDEILILIKELEELKGQEAFEECKVVEKLSTDISLRADEIIDNINAIGEFDLAISKAYLAIVQNAVKPAIIDDADCSIIKGRHPIVEENLKKRGKEYKPISITLDRRVSLITGANMGGKTVSLKMVGLLTAMVHYGLLVPAESMITCLYDFIFMSAGDEQSIDKGLSTFGAEMNSISEMLANSSKRGLVLIDELASGTNPQEGYAISYSIIDFMLKSNCISVITTHFDGLERKELKHLQVKGLRNISENLLSTPELICEYMDYSLIEIEGMEEVPRDAIRISKMMGIPDNIIKKAEEIMNK